jgi:hypothetical protein
VLVSFQQATLESNQVSGANCKPCAAWLSAPLGNVGAMLKKQEGKWSLIQNGTSNLVPQYCRRAGTMSMVKMVKDGEWRKSVLYKWETFLNIKGDNNDTVYYVKVKTWALDWHMVASTSWLIAYNAAQMKNNMSSHTYPVPPVVQEDGWGHCILIMTKEPVCGHFKHLWEDILHFKCVHWAR